MTRANKPSNSPPPPIVKPGDGGLISSPHPHDVLSGRGGRINSHEGNVRFRDIVQSMKRSYLDPNTKKVDKAVIAAEVVNQIRQLNPPGRFLKEDNASGMWVDIGDERARKKAGQALREDAPDIRAGINQTERAVEQPLKFTQGPYGGTPVNGIRPQQSGYAPGPQPPMGQGGFGMQNGGAGYGYPADMNYPGGMQSQYPPQGGPMGPPNPGAPYYQQQGQQGFAAGTSQFQQQPAFAPQGLQQQQAQMTSQFASSPPQPPQPWNASGAGSLGNQVAAPRVPLGGASSPVNTERKTVAAISNDSPNRQPDFDQQFSGVPTSGRCSGPDGEPLRNALDRTEQNPLMNSLYQRNSEPNLPPPPLDDSVGGGSGGSSSRKGILKKFFNDEMITSHHQQRKKKQEKIAARQASKLAASREARQQASSIDDSRGSSSRGSSQQRSLGSLGSVFSSTGSGSSALSYLGDMSIGSSYTFSPLNPLSSGKSLDLPGVDENKAVGQNGENGDRTSKRLPPIIAGAEDASTGSGDKSGPLIMNADSGNTVLHGNLSPREDDGEDVKTSIGSQVSLPQSAIDSIFSSIKRSNSFPNLGSVSDVDMLSITESFWDETKSSRGSVTSSIRRARINNNMRQSQQSQPYAGAGQGLTSSMLSFGTMEPEVLHEHPSRDHYPPGAIRAARLGNNNPMAISGMSGLSSFGGDNKMHLAGSFVGSDDGSSSGRSHTSSWLKPFKSIERIGNDQFGHWATESARSMYSDVSNDVLALDLAEPRAPRAPYRQS